MKKTLFLLATMTLIAFSSFAQTKKDGTPDMRYSANKQSYSPSYSSNSTYTTPDLSFPSNSSLRPVYSGEKHTESHGGSYPGETNSQSHKGGTYVNPKSNNQYGIHKTLKK